MTQAMLSVFGPMLANELKTFGINLPLDQIAPQLSIINPDARTSDLQSAMPGAAGGGSRQHDVAAPAPTQSTERQNPQPIAARVTPPPPVSCLLPDGQQKKMTRELCRANAGSAM
jgi:hypothetical protein